jgi:hypothetical protein
MGLVLIKTWISYIVHTTLVWNKLHHVRSYSLKIGKPQSLKVFGASKPMIVAKTAILTSYRGN